MIDYAQMQSRRRVNPINFLQARIYKLSKTGVFDVTFSQKFNKDSIHSHLSPLFNAKYFKRKA